MLHHPAEHLDAQLAGNSDQQIFVGGRKIRSEETVKVKIGDKGRACLTSCKTEKWREL